MGDMSELRGLVFIGTFLAVTVFLIGWIPVGLYDSPNYRGIVPPDDLWEGVDLIQYANYTDLQFNETGGENWIVDSTFYRMDVSMGGHDMSFLYKRAGTGAYSVRLYHAFNIYWDLWGSGHALIWYDFRGIDRTTYYGDPFNWLELAPIQETVKSDNETSSFRAKCPSDHSITYHTTFRFNSTAYTDFQDAWDNQDVNVLFGLNFDDVGTRYTSWDTISQVLFYQLPNTNPYLNTMIAVPIFIGAVYIAVILVLRMLGAFFGGGA